MTTFTRRHALALAASAALARAGRAASGERGTVDAHDAHTDEPPGVIELARAIASKRTTATAALAACLARIDALDVHGPALRAILELNPDAQAIAQQLDDELAKGKVRGALHGVPVVVKDNIDTADKMSTCAGSLALVGVKRAKDARVVALLRGAGAVVVGKSNMSEWANFRSSHSVSGWSGRGGQTRNPHVLDRNPSGSSSGSAAAVAASLVPGALGSETDGSITSPASSCGIVGFKPSLGELSQKGIIPISAEQDTAGPMARTVADVALLFDVTRERGGRTSLDGATLKGKRVGVCRSLAGFHRDVDALFEDALRALKAEGAILVDPSPLALGPGLSGAELLALTYECKRDLDAYLKALPASSPIHSIADVVKFDAAHAREELAIFGDDLLVSADAKGDLAAQEYLDARKKIRALAGDALADGMKGVDVLVAPTQGPAWLTDPVDGDLFVGAAVTSIAAIAGGPHITVPMGFVHELPVGLSFFASPRADDDVLRYAYAYERATKLRRPPRFLATAPG